MNNIIELLGDVDRLRGNLVKFLGHVEQLRDDVVESYCADDEISKDFWLGEYTAYNNIAYKINCMIENELNKMQNVSRETLKDDLMKTNNPYME